MLLSEPKLIVSDVPGTTRDATDSIVTYYKKQYVFIDTAGVRRRGKIEKGIEKFSIMRTLSSVFQADVVLMIIDGSKNITKQDQHLAGEIIKQKRGMILVVNKWDLREKGDEERDFYIRQLRRKFAFAPWAPVVFISAKTKKNVTKIFPIIEDVIKERNKRIPTPELNAFQSEIIQKHMPAGTKGKTPKMLYVTQAGVNPPEFVFFMRNENAMHFSYIRYI